MVCCFVGVDKVGPADDEYSVQHVKLFALHNFLYADPFFPNVAFIVNKKFGVQRVHFEVDREKLKCFWFYCNLFNGWSIFRIMHSRN